MAKTTVKSDVETNVAEKATETKTTAAKATKTTAKKAEKATETKAEKAATKTAKTTKASTTKAASKKTEEIYLQFSGFEFSNSELVERVKADYIATTGKKIFKSVKLYVKPEEIPSTEVMRVES